MESNTHESDLVNLHGLARRLQLPFGWLKIEAEANRIPCLQIGRHLRFSVSAVERAIAERAAGEYGQTEEVADNG